MTTPGNLLTQNGHLPQPAPWIGHYLTTKAHTGLCIFVFFAFFSRFIRIQAPIAPVGPCDFRWGTVDLLLEIDIASHSSKKANMKKRSAPPSKKEIEERIERSNLTVRQYRAYLIARSSGIAHGNAINKARKGQ